MNIKDKLTEATIKTLQGESSVITMTEAYNTLQYIDDWKKQELDSYLKAFDKEMNHIDQLTAQCKEHNWKINTLSEYREIPMIFKKYQYSRNKQEFKNDAIKEIDDHFQKLQQKVEDVIGNITMIKPTGENGYDYLFVGTNGSCEVKVILAGGYNIQRLHTRWIVNKQLK